MVPLFQILKCVKQRTSEHLKINILRHDFAQISVCQDLLIYQNHHLHHPQLHFFGIYLKLKKCLLRTIFTLVKRLLQFNLFQPNFSFLYPLKTSENPRRMSYTRHDYIITCIQKNIHSGRKQSLSIEKLRFQTNSKLLSLLNIS